MLNFLDNFIEPIQLPAGVEEVETTLALPEGEYILTVTNSSEDPVRHETVFAWTEDGTTWLWRNPDDGLAEWPEGSVIFCGINSHVLEDIYSSIGPGSVEYGSGLMLKPAVGLVDMLAVPAISYVVIDGFSRQGQTLSHTVLANLQPSGTLRIDSYDLPISKAELQPLAGLTFSVSSGGGIDIQSASAVNLRMNLQTIIEDGSVRLIATFEDLGAFTLLTPPAP